MINLFPHQRKVLEATKGKNRVAYYLDMGLGKTFVGSEKLVQFGTSVNLIICQKSKVQDWIDHFVQNYQQDSVPMNIFNLTNKKDYEHFWEAIGISATATGVINYELAWRRKDLLKLKNFTLMLDESSLIQNEKSKRAKFILEMNPDNVILLSGTPTDGKYERLWSQIHLLGWEISKALYMRQYVETEWIEDESGFKIQVITGYKNVERLKSKLASYGVVFMKSDEAFTLPQQIDIPTFIPTSKKYREFVRKSVVTVKKLDEAGSETVVGTDSLKEMIRNAVSVENDALAIKLDRIISLLVQFFPDVLLALSTMELVFDDGTVAAKLAPKMNKELAKILFKKDRGR